MIDHAQRRQYRFQFGDCSSPDNRISTNLEIHLLPPTELIEIVGRLHGHRHRMQRELFDLTREFRAYRRRVGDVFEALAAAMKMSSPIEDIFTMVFNRDRSFHCPGTQGKQRIEVQGSRFLWVSGFSLGKQMLLWQLSTY